MKTTTTAQLSVDDIREAVVFWLRQVKGVEVDGDVIAFRTKAEDDPQDWQCRNAAIIVLDGASFLVKRDGSSELSEAPKDYDIVTRARLLLENTTPGPWRWGDPSVNYGALEDEHRMYTLERSGSGPAPRIRERDEPFQSILCVEDPVNHAADAAFIAASPTLVRELIAECQRLRDQPKVKEATP